MSRCHGWCFTTFTLQPEPIFDERVFQYLIVGRETCPTSGRKHLQGFCWFRERKRLAGAKKIFATAHLEASKGSPEQAANYCKKDGDFTEYGQLLFVKTAGNAFKDFLNASERSDVDILKDQYPGLYVRYKTNILSSLKFRTEELKSCCGVWICGPPRCGKDASVLKLGDVYCKPLNKWWDGYKNERYVLLSDVVPDHGRWLGIFLKIWCDRYAFNAEIKGSSMLIRPEKIFCTSNFKLEEVFKHHVLESLKARMDVFDQFTDTVSRRQETPLKSDVYDKLILFEDGLQKEVLSQTVVVEEADKENSSSDEFQAPKRPPKKKTKLLKTNCVQR
ncbi:Replication-associated protein [Araneus ventricosus]|uniref:ATP-dependent helicase Rep n=1 Tax=Araneus ventricosus TaxID=182803 RepID=A0A4Y2P604_ARAVE|nr:Replication-associated protein [Araneus ventricosus]